MENVLWYSYFIAVYMDPLYGSTSCQNCLWQKCDARGICTEGCIAGYTDKYCQHPCQETCLNSSCDVELNSGRTVCRDGCVDGYCGICCKIPCPEGCLTCDQSHCENCTLCRADLYGAKCEHSCLHKCDGFACNVGGTCLERCIDGRYGANCNVSCQSNHQSCDRDTGQCQQCKVGYFGNVCQHLCPACLTTEDEQLYTCRSGCKVCSIVGVLGQECAVGKYGEHCQLNCSRSCFPHAGHDVHCDRHSGRCSEGCVAGRFGDKCHLSCSRNCWGHICSQQTGYCDGCTGNNAGNFCETPKESCQEQSESKTSQEPASTPLVVLVVPVFIFICIVIFTIAVIVLNVIFRKSRCRKHDASNAERTEMLEGGGVHSDLQTPYTDLIAARKTSTRKVVVG